MATDQKRIKMIEDIATLKGEVKYIKEKQNTNHEEMKGWFLKLQEKVNEEITTAHASIASNRKLFIRLLIVTFAIGSFIWIKESRDWIMRNFFNIF